MKSKKHSRERPAKIEPKSSRKIWAARCAIAVVIPLLVLGGLELALRMMGHGFPTSFFVRTQISGRDFFVTNEKFGYRFFPPALARTPLPLRMSAVKPTNEFRIFLFGESAAQGDPDPSFGAWRYLEALLRERYPGTDFRVVCTAMTAINSHAILPIARECARHDGDMWIIYMGNNELVGPFGASTAFGPRAPNRALVRASLALRKTKIAQWMDTLLAKTSHGKNAPQSWSGLNMFKENKIHPDDPSWRRTCNNFSGNLEDIVSLGNASHVPVLLSTVASNLKDCAPFASLHPANFPGSQKTDWEHLYQDGTNAEYKGDFSGALAAYKNAMKIDPAFAELWFRLGNCDLALTNFKDAKYEFERARDCDALVFRAESRINKIIKDTAARHADKNVHLVDAAEMLAEESPNGITGQEIFYEHVHLNPAGNYLLARAFAGEIALMLPSSITAHAKTNWLPADVCDQRLALSLWDRYRLWQMNFSRVSEPPFTEQLNDVPRAKKYMATMDEIKQQLTQEAAEKAHVMYENAVAASPDDALLRQNYAQFLESMGSFPQAVAEQKRACECLPVYPNLENKLGQLFIRDGKTAEAATCFSNALALNANFVPALNELGIVYANEGKVADAAACFARAKKINPGYLETYFNWGFLEQSQGHLDQALGYYQNAAQIQPNGPAAPFAQAVAAAVAHNKGEAIRNFQTTLWMYPAFWQARYLLGVELATTENVADAQAQFLDVTRRRPDFARAHLNLGVAFAKQGKLDDALAEFTVTLQLSPTNKAAQQFIETTRALKARKERSASAASPP
ncbi:MAG TPA: tetratricopeptide repeat protein [Verrucomicrobiae bacterium]|nr:tetratricopeptide repeat protein [Verrucomicrobiae bacterium]